MFLLIFLQNITAQPDSSGYFDVYRNETQQTLAPQLAGDMGRHIVRSDFRFLHRRTDGDYRPFQYWQAAYQTRLGRHHGFGIISTNIPKSQLLSSNTIGFQYAYGINMGKSKFWKNTKLSLGLGIQITKEESSFDKMVFTDQLYSGQVVRSTAETPTDGPIYYPEFNAGISLRSKRLYLVATGNNLTSPVNGFYLTTTSRQALYVDIQTGIKLFEWKKLSGWANYEISTSRNNNMGKLGTSFSYRHFIAAFKFKYGSSFHYQISYFNPRLRVYAQYETIYSPIYSSSTGGFFSTGIAIGITKQ